jgi:hypothetical protein
MHELVTLIRPTRPCLLRLAVLQNLQNFRLQQPQAKIVMGHNFVCRLLQMRGRVEKTLFGDEAVVEERREFSGHNLICDTLRELVEIVDEESKTYKRPANTGTDKTVE